MTKTETERDHTALTMDERVDILVTLRSAQAQLLEDAEGFQRAASSLERIGQIIARKMRNGFASYEVELSRLAETSCLTSADRFARLFDLVRRSRNDAAHAGAFARHMTSRLFDLLLIMTDAITSEMKTLEDLMVRNPITAEPWHLIGHVRNQMLANSFSFIPYRSKHGWSLISDVSVVNFLKPWDGVDGKRKLLAHTVEEAIEQGGLVASKVDCLAPDKLISDLKPQAEPFLIASDIEGEKRLVGILTAFDLL